MTYTLAQVRAFMAAIDRQERARMASDFALLLVAGRGDKDQVSGLVKELDA